MFRWLIHNLGTILLSLILALMVWFVAAREQDPPVEGVFGPLSVEMTGLPGHLTLVNTVSGQQVRLVLRAPQSSWDNLTPQKFRVWIDLSELEAGLHDVAPRVEIADPAIRVLNTEPRAITVQLEAMADLRLPVEVQLMDEPPLGYQIEGVPITDPITVTIRGPDSQIRQVERAAARLFVGSEKDTFERALEVLPLDANGELVSGLTVSPQKVLAVIPIRQRFGYRDISVRAVTTGTVDSGYWVSGISANPGTVTVVGRPSALRELTGFVETVPIDISNATENIVKRVPLNLPPGVSVVEQGETNGAGILVTVEVAALEGGQTVQREIAVRGVEPGRRWTVSPDRVDVILSGPVPILQALQPDDVAVVLDLFGLELNTVHRLEPVVIVPEGLRVQSVLPERVEVVLSLEPTPTPTPTRTPTVTASGTVTGTVTGTATWTPTPTATRVPATPSPTPTATPR